MAMRGRSISPRAALNRSIRASDATSRNLQNFSRRQASLLRGRSGGGAAAAAAGGIPRYADIAGGGATTQLLRHKIATNHIAVLEPELERLRAELASAQRRVADVEASAGNGGAVRREVEEARAAAARNLEGLRGELAAIRNAAATNAAAVRREAAEATARAAAAAAEAEAARRELAAARNAATAATGASAAGRNAAMANAAAAQATAAEATARAAAAAAEAETARRDLAAATAAAATNAAAVRREAGEATARAAAAAAEAETARRELAAARNAATAATGASAAERNAAREAAAAAQREAAEATGRAVAAAAEAETARGELAAATAAAARNAAAVRDEAAAATARAAAAGEEAETARRELAAARTAANAATGASAAERNAAREAAAAAQREAAEATTRAAAAAAEAETARRDLAAATVAAARNAASVRDEAAAATARAEAAAAEARRELEAARNAAAAATGASAAERNAARRNAVEATARAAATAAELEAARRELEAARAAAAAAAAAPAPAPAPAPRVPSAQEEAAARLRRLRALEYTPASVGAAAAAAARGPIESVYNLKDRSFVQKGGAWSDYLPGAAARQRQAAISAQRIGNITAAKRQEVLAADAAANQQERNYIASLELERAKANAEYQAGAPVLLPPLANALIIVPGTILVGPVLNIVPKIVLNKSTLFNNFLTESKNLFESFLEYTPDNGRHLLEKAGYELINDNIRDIDLYFDALKKIKYGSDNRLPGYLLPGDLPANDMFRIILGYQTTIQGRLETAINAAVNQVNIDNFIAGNMNQNILIINNPNVIPTIRWLANPIRTIYISLLAANNIVSGHIRTVIRHNAMRNTAHSNGNILELLTNQMNVLLNERNKLKEQYNTVRNPRHNVAGIQADVPHTWEDADTNIVYGRFINADFEYLKKLTEVYVAEKNYLLSVKVFLDAILPSLNAADQATAQGELDLINPRIDLLLVAAAAAAAGGGGGGPAPVDFATETVNRTAPEFRVEGLIKNTLVLAMNSLRANRGVVAAIANPAAAQGAFDAEVAAPVNLDDVRLVQVILQNHPSNLEVDIVRRIGTTEQIFLDASRISERKNIAGLNAAGPNPDLPPFDRFARVQQPVSSNSLWALYNEQILKALSNTLLTDMPDKAQEARIAGLFNFLKLHATLAAGNGILEIYKRDELEKFKNPKKAALQASMKEAVDWINRLLNGIFDNSFKTVLTNFNKVLFERIVMQLGLERTNRQWRLQQESVRGAGFNLGAGPAPISKDNELIGLLNGTINTISGVYATSQEKRRQLEDLSRTASLLGPENRMKRRVAWLSEGLEACKEISRLRAVQSELNGQNLPPNEPASEALKSIVTKVNPIDIQAGLDDGVRRYITLKLNEARAIAEREDTLSSGINSRIKKFNSNVASRRAERIGDAEKVAGDLHTRIAKLVLAFERNPAITNFDAKAIGNKLIELQLDMNRKIMSNSENNINDLDQQFNQDTANTGIFLAGRYNPQATLAARAAERLGLGIRSTPSADKIRTSAPGFFSRTPLPTTKPNVSAAANVRAAAAVPLRGGTRKRDARLNTRKGTRKVIRKRTTRKNRR